MHVPNMSSTLSTMARRGCVLTCIQGHVQGPYEGYQNANDPSPWFERDDEEELDVVGCLYISHGRDVVHLDSEGTTLSCLLVASV